MKRRTFMKTAGAALIADTMLSDNLLAAVSSRDMTYDPDQPLESTGLRVRDVMDILDRGEKFNTPPVLREEILDNPDAVFIIKGGIRTTRDSDGNWQPCTGQMERFGRRVSSLVFRKGTDAGGRTFIKPNIVGIPRNIEQNGGGNVHPYFIVGMTDDLHAMGNTNVAIGARGALRHPQVVASGFQDLLNEHNLPLIEAHVQYFRDYDGGELVWHENPEGVVARRFPSYKPAFMDGTTFINIAHAHTHPVGHTTLTIKNIMGSLPRGYGHICDAWSTLDIWRRQFMKDFNHDFRPQVEKAFVRHINEGYKHWDKGGFFKKYQAAGGYEAYLKARAAYENAKGTDREKALDNLYNVADSWLYASEQWSQRMMDIISVVPQPYVNMVEGTFARGAQGTELADFVTVGRRMVNVDAVTTWLMGHDPRAMPYLRIAVERGIPGSNDIERIPVYILDEKGPRKVDYRTLERQSLGINVNRIREDGPDYF